MANWSPAVSMQYLEMQPYMVEPTYAYLQPRPAMMVGSVSRGTYQKSKKSWLRLTKEKHQRSQHVNVVQQHPQIHPAALLHRDYLQEYREKFGPLAPDHLDPWNSPLRQYVHPAVVAAASPAAPAITEYSTNICACPGTKKMGKVCKTCGQRAAKGTVRGGTITRGATKVRPALPLPPAPTIKPMRLRPTPTTPSDEEENTNNPDVDPYDMVRRSRLAYKEQNSGRARSKSFSPTRARLAERLRVADEWVSTSDTSDAASSGDERGEPEGAPEPRRSILECDVSAYELIGKYLKHSESDELDDNAVAAAQAEPPPPTVPAAPELPRTNSLPSLVEKLPTPKPPPRRRRLKKVSIKSILKKTSVSSEEGYGTLGPSGLHFPTYQEFKQRKKQVQFKSDELRKCQQEKPGTGGNDLGPGRAAQVGFSGAAVEVAAAAAAAAADESERPAQSQQDCAQDNKQHPHEQLASDTSDKEDVPKDSDEENKYEDCKPAEAAPVAPGRGVRSSSSRRREGGSIVHVRGDHHNLFLDTMRLRVSHRRADSRQVFAAQPVSRMLSPPRPREPPPPPPAASPTKGEVVVVGSPVAGRTVVTVNNQDHLTLRINVGGGSEDANTTIVTLNGDVNDNYSGSTVPHICTKMGEVTVGDCSIVQKVENTRRSRVSTEAPYVSIRVNQPEEEPYVSVVCSESGKDEPSITDDEASNGSSKVYVTVEDEDEEFDDEEIEDHYEMIRDPIYEEISVPPPAARSIFEGASKYDILQYLAGAKERGLHCPPVLDLPALRNSISAPMELASHVSDSSEDSHPPLRSSPTKSRRSSAEIERNDSGVGSETSQSSRSRWLLQRRTNPDQGDLLCEDCEQTVEPQVTDSGVVYAPLVCRKCGKRRSERREIITELLETEVKYGRDLQIMMEEFYRPMLVAGLLTQEQLDAIFLNVPDLLEMSKQLAERLQDAVDIALDQGDEDLLTVNVGRQFISCTQMLNAFESYCIRQGGASLLLASLEKEKELLKIFLRVSQMENAVLRRMNLNSFLMVPVQRVTKYPLLLSRLYKTTPPHHEARELLKQAQQKIEAHLEHMNAEAKEISSTKLWRRISIINVPGRRSNSEADLNIKLRKLALDVLGWNPEITHFVMEGRLLFTQPTDSNWRKGRTIKLSHLNVLLVTLGKPNANYKPESQESGELTFPKATGIQEACLLLLKDKAGRCTMLREPLSLDKCIVCTEVPDVDDCFEVQEIATRDTFIFKSENKTKEWVQALQYHAQSLGGWRRRRNALANIMMNGMVPRS
ncbi:uncharacterized protein LOC132204126 [Neocloeon triangulifer]|uniref:uncharacterized protein LOC132204126 n=1 Tax=Neocloeon triangulifer TaxID=2078957 RepID=UPI00286F2B89|nr:uncharacterized protein LOC132204126 [Neocloeon triangulifer]XP_059488391.1 uncharacterized protein LOC132204126 [Neocloeon triangulifer]